MRTRSIETNIYLPPGALASTIVRDLLRLCFEEFHWFAPIRYGVASLKPRLDPNRPDMDALVGFYEERKALLIAARTDAHFMSIHPTRPDAPLYAGSVSWTIPEASASRSTWRDNHAAQTVEVMKLVTSPLAVTALVDDIKQKTIHIIHDDLSLTDSFTVRDYSEGLAGLFWRNFYGPPFVRLFGERLISLPAESRGDLGNGIVLVQPYELPGEANTEQGKARERALIQHLGPECFYDHALHLKPTRLPDLSSLASQT